MHVAGTLHRGPGAGGYRAGGAAGGSDQALHPLEQVRYIIDTSTRDGYILRFFIVKFLDYKIFRFLTLKIFSFFFDV